jgi:hypothetical protein
VRKTHPFWYSPGDRVGALAMMRKVHILGMIDDPSLAECPIRVWWIGTSKQGIGCALHEMTPRCVNTLFEALERRSLTPGQNSRASLS